MNNFFRTDFNLPSFSSIDNDGSSNNNNPNNNNPSNNNPNYSSNNFNNGSNQNNFNPNNNNSNNNNSNNSNNNNSNNNNSNNNNSNNNNSNNNNSNNSNNNSNNNYNNSNFNNNFNNPNNNNFNSNNNNNRINFLNNFNNPNNNNNTNFYNPNTNNNFNNNNTGFNNNGGQNSNFNGNLGSQGQHFNSFSNNNFNNSNYNPNNNLGYGGNGGNNYNYIYGNNGNNSNSNINANMNFRPQQGVFSSPDNGRQQQQHQQQQQQQLPPFSFQAMQNQQYQQQAQQQQQLYSQQSYHPQHQQQAYQQQEQQPQYQYGYSDNYRSFMSLNVYNSPRHSYPLYRSDSMSLEGPIRSQPRSTPMDNGHSVRFNPSRNYNIEANETSSTSGTGTGTFLARPKIPGLPCIACSMSRNVCDGGSPCRSCHQNRVRCHYEGDNNTRFFEIESLQLEEPSAGQQSASGKGDNRENSDNHDGRAPPAQANSFVARAASPSFTASSPSTSQSSRNPNSRSRSRSGSGSIGSGSGSGTLNARQSQDLGYTRVSPVISSPIMLSDQSLISIPPFQDVHQVRSQHSRVTLPSISSMGSNTRTSSSAKATTGFNASPRSGAFTGDRDQTSASRAQTEWNNTDSTVKRTSSKKQQQQQQQQNQPQPKNQSSQQMMPPKDPLYSLSSASIRARKNALEMENIQRASHVYSDYIAKIKELSGSIGDTSSKITATYLSEHCMKSHNRMSQDTSEKSATSSSPQGDTSSSGVKNLGPIDGLMSMGRSGMLHSLVQQYFTLVHPQFMVLHKNRFLVRFWAEFGSFPEANELQNQVIENAKATKIWRGPVDEDDANDEKKKLQTVCPLLLLAMLALVSRHFNDRSLLKSTAADKQQRVEHSLALLSKEFQDSMNFMLNKHKNQEARMYDLLEADTRIEGPSGESMEDRGELYFQWATELLKDKYEEPSLTVVQSLLLMREYAIMAGHHTQAYMYGGTAITMAMGLGWHHAEYTTLPGQERSLSSMDLGEVLSETEEIVEAEGDESKEKKAIDEEQRLCWWHCFIIDRWMSAIYNRPVNIPIHIFDKTLMPPPKILRTWGSKETDDPQTPMNIFSSSNFTDPKQPENETVGSHIRKTLNRDPLSIGSGVPIRPSPYLPGPNFRVKAFFNQQCRQALLLDDILSFLSSWSDDLFVSSVEFEKLSQSLDDWHQALADWQTFPLSGIVSAKHQQQQHGGQRRSNTCNSGTRDDDTIGVTAAGIQQMNSNLDDEPRLSTPAKINLLKTIRILRDADRSSWGPGVQDGLQLVLREVFPAQMKQMWANA
ncbi:hypothetical protein FBU30_010645 [Linnemannia zychae]|nr:hypothetical protein FBU30_010645 [Linnemannia zychae]